MARSSRISKLELGDEIIACYVSGIPVVDIVRKMNVEHEGADLNRFHVKNYLDRHIELVRSKRDKAIGNSLSLTIEKVQSALIETVEEIRTYLVEFGDDPAHVVRLLKLKLDALEIMARMLGGYAPAQPVNLQVSTNTGLCTQENFEKDLRESVEYFRRIEAATANE